MSVILVEMNEKENSADLTHLGLGFKTAINRIWAWG